MIVPDVRVRPVDALTWELLEPLTVHTVADSWVVPAGYKTDFASVPRAVVWAVPRYGLYTTAAILHDYLITDVLPTGQVDSRTVDRVFREVMRDLGVPAPRRWLMWAGVRWGALGNPARRGGWGWLRTAPGTLLVSLLALPIVLPGGLGVLTSSLLAWVLGLFMPRADRPTSWRT